MTYIRCPRCELNYIEKKQKFCNVCKSEMKASGEIVDESEMKPCPVCHTNSIRMSQDMCDTCRDELGTEYILEEELDTNWEEFIDEDLGGERDGRETEEEDEISDIVENGTIMDMDDEELGLAMDDDFSAFGDDADFDFDADMQKDVNAGSEDDFDYAELDGEDEDFDDDFDDDDLDDEEDEDEDFDDDFDDDDDFPSRKKR